MSSSRLHSVLQKHASTAGVAAMASLSAVSITLLDDDVVHPPKYPWRHMGYFSSFDCGALRRGFQVYREVCATCHSLERLRFRELVGMTHSKDEATEIAKSYDIVDGPNAEGEMYERPGKLLDSIPSPYANEQAGRAANGGALPPDLSLMVKARHDGHDYLFALLTGYCDPPEGKTVMEGLYYNPYFPGGAIAMPPPLNDEGVEYEDGTVATISQQARDVTQFLHWVAEPEQDERKKAGGLWYPVLGFLVLASGYYKRWRWSPLKSRVVSYVKGRY